MTYVRFIRRTNIVYVRVRDARLCVNMIVHQNTHINCSNSSFELIWLLHSRIGVNMLMWVRARVYWRQYWISSDSAPRDGKLNWENLIVSLIYVSYNSGFTIWECATQIYVIIMRNHYWCKVVDCTKLFCAENHGEPADGFSFTRIQKHISNVSCL